MLQSFTERSESNFTFFRLWGYLMFHMSKGLSVYKIFMSTSSIRSPVNLVPEISVYLNF